MAVTLGQMDWRLGVDSADFQRGLANAEDQARGFGSKITGVLATGAKVAFGAAVVGVGAFGAVLAQSVKEAGAAEEITAQLNAVIKSTGGIAEVTTQRAEELALGLSKVTRFEDDAIVSAESLLLTFTKIGKDVFPKATALTLDLATAMKMDLASAAKMMGKALNDPVAGLTAMGRAGVQFTKEQKEMIKAMVEAGDVAGAQRLIMAELELQVGGSARAAGETMAGQMDILRNALGNVKEEIGGALIPIIKDFVTWIGPKLTAGLQKFSDWFRTSLVDVQQFAGQLGKAKDMIGDMIADVNKGEKIKWQDLMNLAGIFTNSMDIQRRFATIVTDIQTGIGQIKEAFETGGIGAAAGVAWDMATGAISKAIDSVDWTKVKADLETAANKAMATIEVAWGNLVIAVKSVDWTAVHAEIQRVAGEAWAVYSAVFLDENKQAQLAWDIQAGIKGAFAIVKAELEGDETTMSGIADGFAAAFNDSFAQAMQGPTAPLQDFIGQILDYAFPEMATFGDNMGAMWDTLAFKIENVKTAIENSRKEKTLFDTEMSKALTNPFQAIVDVVKALTLAIQKITG